MKKLAFLVLLSILSFNSYSQIKFEKGYFITNDNEQTECLINNLDWRRNPAKFEYKLKANSGTKTLNIENVKEFGVYNYSTYKRFTVQLDSSSNVTSELNYQREPRLGKEETLFLKELIKGKAILYQYIGARGNLQRFFYTVEGSALKQLIYKRYLKTSETGDKIAANNAYKQELWNGLECKTLILKDVENLSYKESSLVKYFTRYNQCKDVDFVRKEVISEGKKININLRAGGSLSILSIQRNGYRGSASFLGTGFRIGAELEYIFPYKKNKWSLIFEPAYQTSKGKGGTLHIGVVTKVPHIDYKEVQIPIGLRYYMFVNDDARFFMNAILISHFPTKNAKVFFQNTQSYYASSPLHFDIKPRGLAVGFGYRSKGRVSFETRYEINRDLVKEYTSWKSNYNVVSFILGFRVL